jgi:hypothetical protein
MALVEDAAYFLCVVKSDGTMVKGCYSYLGALARLQHASTQDGFCHAELNGPAVLAHEVAPGCPHIDKTHGGTPK